MADATSGSVSLPVLVQRDRFSPKESRWSAKIGPVTGYGPTAAGAKYDLRQKLIAAIQSSDTDPAFARDDDGSLIVAIQKPHGAEHWRITGDRARCITACDGPPRRSLEGVHHYTPIGGEA